MTIQKLLSMLEANLNQTDITLYPGASEQLIQQFEQDMSLILPLDFKTFYSFCNGFESAEDLFRIIPLEEILERKNEFDLQQFYIAEYLIYADMWEVELLTQSSSYRIHHMNVTLTDSLATFIDRFLRGGIYTKDGLLAWPYDVRR